ncbi:MAG: bifunctional diaminohydroxyphosphoribosylaminopyrimidine deaminase/5-amino-6-(5-phosphoribosylamino)uracil reductase RibD [Actinomycetota bacterium]|nr:bifunctional diaminohydroxyphosphoribosylaminopyrimidine deaminase/5-amino-6-(5-phosphoribosylamino)uracil reductase RibD [Actinomycetota bacterium]
MKKEDFTKEDKKFMGMALHLAEKGKGTVSPNPMVGAVIVKDNIFISGGFHAKAGFNHAEINAIENAKKKIGYKLPEGLKMYVTLEPCSIYGRTPPCADSLISNKFSEIIISILDPNPKINGQGFIKLKQAGLNVRTGLLEEQAKKLNEIFFTNIIKKRPFICAKTASTLDGNLAARTGDSKWITDEKSRMLVQKLRFEYGCVLTGINTVIKDNPFYTLENHLTAI